MAEKRILVVDDEPGVRTALEGILADEGFRVVSVGTGEAGLDALERERFDAVLLDVWLPGIDGLETLQQLRDRGSDTEVVMISGHGTIETAVRATKLGAFDFVEKPLSLEKTLLVLRNALRQRRLEQHNRHLLEQLDRDTEIVGRSAAAEKLRRQVEAAAESEAPVLICGEQGSGREQVARRIHAASARVSEAFVEIPCATLDSATIEKVIYGQGDRPGRLQLAAAGSLFLEDVDQLEAALQRKLAATVNRPEEDVRVLASVGPQAAVLERALEQVLDVIRIDVPALRERRDDVPLLAERFLLGLAREYGRPSKRLAPDGLAALKAHDWPGNVRELHNLMERLLLFVPDESVSARDLPESLGGARPPAEDLYREFGSLAEGVQAFERYYVARVMSEHAADRRAVAKKLKITLASLEERLKEL